MTASLPPVSPSRPSGHASVPPPPPPLLALAEPPVGVLVRSRAARGGRSAMVVATIAILIALVALAVAGWAVLRANAALVAADATSAASTRVAAPEPSAPVDPASGTAASGTPTATPPPPLDPAADYPVAYQNEQLTVRVPPGGERGVDVDRPSLDADADITLYGGSGTVTLGVDDGATAALAEDPSADPGDCAGEIQRAALDREGDYPLREGSVFCVVTGTRLAVITIAGISEDQTVSIQASAFVVSR